MNEPLIIFLFFFGFSLVMIGLIKNSMKCKNVQIVYRYIPRTFEEEQEEPVQVSDIFKSMFTNNDPWVQSTTSYDTRKMEEINKYYISQVLNS